jgi:hypothetical protein
VPRCDARRTSRRDAPATPTTPTAPGGIPDWTVWRGLWIPIQLNHVAFISFLSCMFGLLSDSSTLLVRDSPGQPGAALRRLRAPGRGATAPGVNLRRCRRRSPSHRIRAGHSLRGSIINGSNSPFSDGELEQGGKTRARRARAYPQPVHPDLCVYSYFPTLLHPRFARLCLELSPSGQFQLSLHLVYRIGTSRTPSWTPSVMPRPPAGPRRAPPPPTLRCYCGPASTSSSAFTTAFSLLRDVFSGTGAV